MEGEYKKHYCEDCGKFDEAEIPADCLAGHGKVAFKHGACADFIQKGQIINSNGRDE